MAHRTSGNTALSDALIGAAAGALAVWVMDRVDWFNFEHEDPRARRKTQAARPGGMDPAHVAVKKVAEKLGTSVGDPENNAAGLATHYAIGVAPAALYGVLRQKVPELSTGQGVLFGLGLFLIQDEAVNALTGLSGPPREYPWQAHARGLVAHAIYGLVLETTLTVTDTLRR